MKLMDTLEKHTKSSWCHQLQPSFFCCVALEWFCLGLAFPPFKTPQFDLGDLRWMIPFTPSRGMKWKIQWIHRRQSKHPQALGKIRSFSPQKKASLISTEGYEHTVTHDNFEFETPVIGRGIIYDSICFAPQQEFGNCLSNLSLPSSSDPLMSWTSGRDFLRPR